jgi:hypothetical protein
LGWVGCAILGRGGDRKVHRITVACMLILITLSSTLIFWVGQANGWIYPVLALSAAPFPLAFYLDRKQSKSTSQPTSANVS